MVKDGADNNFLLRFSGSNANEQELRIPSLVNAADLNMECCTL